MRTSTIGATALWRLALAGPFAALTAQDSPPAIAAQAAEPDALSLARGAAAWLRETAVPHDTDGAVGWRAVPAQTQRPTVPTLYSGSAGATLFLLEMARADGGSWQELALSAARGLAADLPAVQASGQAGLFTGVAGMLVALQVSAERCADPEEAARLKRLVQRGVAWLVEAAKPSDAQEGALTFGPVTDIISGDAGVGEFALWIAERGDLDEDTRTHARNLAEGLARHLVGIARDAKHGCRWAMSPTYPRFMPNYSHGTAGVAAFLAATGARGMPGREQAIGGGRWLRHLADARGMIHHHQPGGEELFYWSWCHGPAGTSILFERLHALTDDAAWLEAARQPVAAVLASGLPQTRQPGLWETVGACCGTAGLGHYLLRTAPDDERVRDTIDAIVADLSERAVHEDNGALHWPQAEHRVRPDLIQSQVGWAQGAAGIGLFLLRVDAWQRGTPAPDRFPWAK